MEARICPGLGQTCYRRYRSRMSSHPAPGAPPELWKPHPDDEAEIGEAMQAATLLGLLSPDASEAFIRWMEGTGDEAWRVELE